LEKEIMKVAFIGASGNVGSRILAELLGRGHEVTAIVRHPEKLETQDKLTLQKGDITQPDSIVPLLEGHEAVLVSVGFGHLEPDAVTGAVKRAGVPRVLIVGGAGSLEVAPGVQVVDTPEFPAAWKAEASKGRDFLNGLRAETELDWTFLSPAALIQPGERTGQFRLGTDQLLTDEKGDSKISTEDYAIAFVDELEEHRHPRQRFTVAY
jgi:uncharacterized protein